MSNNLERIAASLKRIQNEGGSGNFVIFTIPAKAYYYIQFAGEVGDARLYAEAVSNNYLTPKFALDKDQMTQLQSVGWHSPSTDKVNFYQEWQARTDEDRIAIAQEILDVFTEVYGLIPDRSLNVELVLDDGSDENRDAPENQIIQEPVEIHKDGQRKVGKLIFENGDIQEIIPVYWQVSLGEISEGNTWKADISFTQNWKLPEKAKICIFHYLRNLTAEMKLQINDETIARCGVIMEEYESMEDFYSWGVVTIVSPDLGRAFIEKNRIWGNILRRDDIKIEG